MAFSPLMRHRKERSMVNKPLPPYRADGDMFCYHGDARATLSTFPQESIDCVVTSPPYYGLRDYGVEGQLGMESSLDEYVDYLVTAFEEVRRVLVPWGALWLNLGDTYNNRTRVRNSSHQGINGLDDRDTSWQDRARAGGVRMSHGRGYALKEKDLMLVPACVALALREAGWWLRGDIIWHKPNGLPESVKDRPTSSHEHVYLLAKSKRYYYGYAAIAEPVKALRREGPSAFRGQAELRPRGERRDAWTEHGIRNRRDVWTVAPQPFKGRHSATMPERLAQDCILAGCPQEGVVLDPFLGAGTTALVARRNNRYAVGIELSEPNLRSALERLDAET